MEIFNPQYFSLPVALVTGIFCFALFQMRQDVITDQLKHRDAHEQINQAIALMNF